MNRRDLLLALSSVPLVGCTRPPETPLAHLHGQDWVRGTFELYANGYAKVETRAEEASRRSYAVLARKGIVALDGLQARGVPFFLRVDPRSERFEIERTVPERLTFTAQMSEKDRAEAKASFERAREHVHTDYEEIRRLNGAMTSLLSEVVRVRNAIDAGELEQFRLVAMLGPLKEGQAPFALPSGVSPPDFEGVVYLLLARLEDDLARLAEVEAGMVTVGLVARATDAGSGSLAANVRKVLVGVEDDNKNAPTRPPTYPAEREAPTTRGKEIAARIAASEPYKAWKKREDGKLADGVGGFLGILDTMTGIPVSAVYKQVLDMWRGDADYLSYLGMAARFLPGGSALAKTIEDARGKTERTRTALAVLSDDPSAADVAKLAEKKGVGMVNTGSRYGLVRLRKQLVFFGDKRELDGSEEALRATGL